MSGASPRVRLGVDLGGTKIEAAALDADGVVRVRRRCPTPRDDYVGTIAAIRDLIAAVGADASAAPDTPVGIGMPGSISPTTGRVQNANSTWLNGRPFAADLRLATGRPVRLANDANCFALSEASDGAAAGAASVFGVILGTGVGGGIVIGGRIVDGRRGIGGEWGHNPLPWPTTDEIPGPKCWCGRHGCMETWASGPALAADHRAHTGIDISGEAIVAAAGTDAHMDATLARHAGRLARGLAHVVNLIDPDVIVLGGGLSDARHLYQMLPPLMAPFVFADTPVVDIRPPRWGATSGVRGAAWLWP